MFDLRQFMGSLLKALKVYHMTFFYVSVGRFVALRVDYGPVTRLWKSKKLYITCNMKYNTTGSVAQW